MPIRKKRTIFKAVSSSLSLLAFLMVLFELSLTMHGGWDDVNFGVVFIAPLIAAVAMLFAIVNAVKFRSKSYEIVPALAMVAVSALFFCYVMVYASATFLARA